jgi:hypothetical protein
MGAWCAKKKEEEDDDVSEVAASNGKMAGKNNSKRYRRYNSLPNMKHNKRTCVAGLKTIQEISPTKHSLRPYVPTTETGQLNVIFFRCFSQSFQATSASLRILSSYIIHLSSHHSTSCGQDTDSVV